MLGAIVVGIIAGWLAGKLVRGAGFGLIGDLILGLVGGFVGAWIFGALGVAGPNGALGEISGRHRRRRSPGLDLAHDPVGLSGRPTLSNRDNVPHLLFS